MKLIVWLTLIGMVLYPLDLLWHLIAAITRRPGTIDITIEARDLR